MKIPFEKDFYQLKAICDMMRKQNTPNSAKLSDLDFLIHLANRINKELQWIDVCAQRIYPMLCVCCGHILQIQGNGQQNSRSAFLLKLLNNFKKIYDDKYSNQNIVLAYPSGYFPSQVGC